jgi:predicted sulfurtransferase/23S rRNA-/tRNA-specific pseudouridylate synthase
MHKSYDESASAISPTEMSFAEQQSPSATRPQQHSIILFYKYHPLSPDHAITERYRAALELLCRELGLTGRILVAASLNEGLNGTLAGSFDSVKAFTVALMMGQNGSPSVVSNDDQSSKLSNAIDAFQNTSRLFFKDLGVPELFMKPEEFKWSNSTTNEPLFPDLNVKLVKELIGTGGLLESIPISETAQGYLSPKDWHEQVRRSQENKGDTILIDCRNTKEYEIGHFPGAVDPQTTTFSQFGKWVRENEHILAEKQVLMYCTGGIRCEKVSCYEAIPLLQIVYYSHESVLTLSKQASAYIRRQVPAVKGVNHLKGGIHKYLEEFGQDGLWQGKNFVFDNRVATSAEETRIGREGNVLEDKPFVSEKVVGNCIACSLPYDEFNPACVCTVCREPVLACKDCQESLMEYHCRQHAHLSTCYFSNLECFTAPQLLEQLHCLENLHEEIAVGRKFKHKRKTLEKQMVRIRSHLDQKHNGAGANGPASLSSCRHCGDVECIGRCWGFHGLKRKERLDYKQKEVVSEKDETNHPSKRTHVAIITRGTALPTKKERLVEEITSLRLSMAPDAYRDEATGIRVPPCTTRVLRCYCKPKWCGQPILQVLKEEFIDMSRPQNVQRILDNRLLRLNGKPIEATDASQVLLRSGDLISRIVHWHEPPVIVPTRLAFQKILLPYAVVDEYNLTGDACVFVCDKPSSVPVHPAGPYLCNTLTIMIEAQEQFPPSSLVPLHRIDRVTSGLVLLCSDSDVARIFHRCLSEAGEVRKIYIAKVQGKFYSSSADLVSKERGSIGCFKWDNENHAVEVDAPVETVDPANGIRAVTSNGKLSKSLFRLEKYDSESDTSLISCYPITGRNHQLRVHLQCLGYPIIGDCQYGGKDASTDSNSEVLPLLEASLSEPENALRLNELSVQDLVSAKASCVYCSGGRDSVLRSFTKAQLLQGGHAIHLHALRYQVGILARKRKTTVAELSFSVTLPQWASGLDPNKIEGLITQ